MADKAKIKIAGAEPISVTFTAANPQTPIFKSASNSGNVQKNGHIWLANYSGGVVEVVFNIKTAGYTFDISNGPDSAISISTDPGGLNPPPAGTFTCNGVSATSLQITVVKADAGKYYYKLTIHEPAAKGRRRFTIGDPIIVNR
jgi:hypothetical protein